VKISQAIRKLYEEQKQINDRLAARVKELFEGSKPEGWFYHGRVKEVESFAQKLETGRFADPAAVEDFFACTLVVENRSVIETATQFVERFCSIEKRRPPDPSSTFKRPDSFVFDDLRLYVKLDPVGPPDPITDILFEVQIKTFLQHAWAIATRDLIYKGEEIHWGKARLAYQIKAMLEHAEISIAEVDTMSSTGALSVTDPDTQKRNQVLDWLRQNWGEEQLPADRRRLVDTLLDLARAIHLDIEQLFDAVARDTERGAGTHLRNLSPYSTTVKALFTHQPRKLQHFLRDRNPRWKMRLLLGSDMEIDFPTDAHAERYIFLDAQAENASADDVPETTR
jgi:hypothetical protein